MFDTQQSKYDIIMTSLWIYLLLLLRDFILENCHAELGGNWTTNKGETGEHNGSPTYIITKYPSLNSDLISRVIVRSFEKAELFPCAIENYISKRKA